MASMMAAPADEFDVAHFLLNSEILFRSEERSPPPSALKRQNSFPSEPPSGNIPSAAISNSSSLATGTTNRPSAQQYLPSRYSAYLRVAVRISSAAGGNSPA